MQVPFLLAFAVLANAFGSKLTETAVANSSSQGTIPELARQNQGNPVVRGRLVDIPSSTLEELTRGAELVLDATLTTVKSYLTPDEKDILTDYEMAPNRIFLGELSPVRAMPGITTPLILAVYGGEMTIEGRTVAVVDHAFTRPKHGGRYLLFLRRYGTEGRYQFYEGGAFEITSQGLKALASRDGDTLFKDIVGHPLITSQYELRTSLRRSRGELGDLGNRQSRLRYCCHSKRGMRRSSSSEMHVTESGAGVSHFVANTPMPMPRCRTRNSSTNHSLFGINRVLWKIRRW